MFRSNDITIAKKEAKREFKRTYKPLGIDNIKQLIKAKETLEEELKTPSSDYTYKYELFNLISQHIDSVKFGSKLENMSLNY